ncbi:hypothetical protein MATL_G00185620 [Megalops atlanticus]|uniref:Uncharacterized protein n=1 Tax=Megalops atlanticus TaxID=7932 RepID=A0A9D3PP92_MEGAT|nr:hypothetical protein MATL_G00185620 [Megalops atlanticus]
MEAGIRSPKTPTCILFDENQKFQSFGYEAMMAYCRMDKRAAKESYFFENFKMEIFNKKINRNFRILAKNGQPFSALKVFSESLRFMKEHALNSIKTFTSGKQFIESDITWVVTVPAIWDAAAKQFMREAATQAGLVSESNSKDLIIALEPEAASVWCRQLPCKGFVSEGSQTDKLEDTPGTQYIVLDCGGGTVDITVHEVLEGGLLKELYKASGGDMGGANIDKNLKHFLRDIFDHEYNNSKTFLISSKMSTELFG